MRAVGAFASRAALSGFMVPSASGDGAVMDPDSPPDTGVSPVEGETRAHDVFVSYASEDRPRAAAIVDALLRQGFSVWWDSEIDANEAFSPSIEQALDVTHAVVVLWSRHSVEKAFVREEAVRGQDRLIPVLLDDAHIPLGFGQVSSVDLRRWRCDELSPALDPLIAAVASRVGRGPRQQTPSPWLVLRSVYLDLTTRIVLAGLLPVSVAAWLLRGPELWRLDDFRWASLLLLIIAVGWAALRAGRFARALGWRVVASGVVAMLLVAWAAAVWRHYAPPRFGEDDLGLVVTRFQGDGLDSRVQKVWTVQLDEQRRNLDTDAVQGSWIERIRVAPLHRTVTSHDQASALASRLKALIVVWGMADGSTGLSLAPRTGFFQLGSMALADVRSLSLGRAAAVALSTSVDRFAAGYGAYVYEDLDSAQRLLRDVADALVPDRDAPAAHVGLLATTHLLLGNAAFLAGCRPGAIQACSEAIDHYQSALDAVQPREATGNYFVEASNNMAVALHMLTKGFETTMVTLADAARACHTGKASPLACRYVAFNQAVVATDGLDHNGALALLTAACGPDVARPGADEAGVVFAASCRQQQAYTSAKLGESAAAESDAARWFARAATYADEALAVLATADVDADAVRLTLSVTRARIAFGRRDYRAARALLADHVEADAHGRPVFKPSSRQTNTALEADEIAALWAVARNCSEQAAMDAPVLSAAIEPITRAYLARHLLACQTEKERQP
ncbi:toll/interleukin-1 receptor domain-containing protein [Accumulibacter sp.]|uniref:toll/interleukin-1 receptor domain-containing protein n=1 Tax=Accumulibacter sp. TaxID=2053492 RepID=UPI002B9A707E|nr:toll/interleukin-1 receptor domain-containing protein [Accumulibacter sp.]HRF06906.1 toll/interleukin-1 receptor domain-containing protein [Accumulibacter sp.]